jgi:hypothetical protein
MSGSTGAGIISSTTDLDVISCEFSNLAATNGGAGIWQTSSSLLLDDCKFENCNERAIAIAGSGVSEAADIRNCTFIGNSENNTGGGGAINARDLGAGFTISGCYFTANAAVSGGGAVLVSGSDPWIIDSSVFVGNVATTGGSGGGGIVTGGDGTLSGCTFVGNGAGFGGPCAFVQFGSVTLVNNVFHGSLGPGAVYAFQSQVAPECNVYWNNGGGNVTGFTMASTSREVDPLFCDTPNGDFTVQEDSPCLPANSLGCGLIGALGQGCGSVSVEQRSWGAIKGGYR